MTIIIMALLGAFLWRLRGGLLNSLAGKANWMGFNDTVVRGIWAVGMAWAFWLTHPGHAFFGQHYLPAWTAPGLLGVALFAGTTIVGWFGAALYPTRWRDVGLLSLSGVLRMSFVALALLSPIPLFGGLLFGPAYWLGSKIPHPMAWMFWGEIITGAMIGACLGMT